MPPPSPPTSPQPDPARQLGRYELIAQIASGGMGAVLLGRLAGAGGFQRLFAIKLLHATYARDTEFVEMLLDEARIAAGIHHSNVVGIHEICQSDEHGYYLVMDYVEGFALSDVMESVAKPGPAHWRMTNRMLVDALMGLDAAHSLLDAEGKPLNVVHRDVSPQNILVGVDGVARVTDFGVARAAARISHSQVGQVKGKLPYMAPEQARGEDLDARTDLFAMGVVLWETITGRRLFKRENVQKTAEALLRGEIPSVSAVAPGVPPALEAVCARALQRDPAARYQSAREFARALEVGARAHRMLADVHEVGAWLRKAFDEQLSTRRSAIREATGSGALRLGLADALPGGLRVPRLPDRPVRPQTATQNLRPPGSRSLAGPLAAERATAPGDGRDDTETHGQANGDEGPSLTPVRPMETVSALLAAAGVEPARPAPAQPVASPPRPVTVRPPRPRATKPGPADVLPDEEPTKTPVNDMRVVEALIAAATAESLPGPRPPTVAPAVAPVAVSPAPRAARSEPPAELYEEPTKTPVNDFKTVTALLTAATRDSLPAPPRGDADEPSNDTALEDDVDDEPTELTQWSPSQVAARRAGALASREKKPAHGGAPVAKGPAVATQQPTPAAPPVRPAPATASLADEDDDQTTALSRKVARAPAPAPAPAPTSDDDEDTRLVARARATNAAPTPAAAHVLAKPIAQPFAPRPAVAQPHPQPAPTPASPPLPAAPPPAPSQPPAAPLPFAPMPGPERLPEAPRAASSLLWLVAAGLLVMAGLLAVVARLR